MTRRKISVASLLIGGLAATPTGKAISKRVLIQDIEMLDEES